MNSITDLMMQLLWKQNKYG